MDGAVIRAFIRYYFSRTVANWRALRRECMERLPKQEKAQDIEESGK
jgi:hypothetical protein